MTMKMTSIILHPDRRSMTASTTAGGLCGGVRQHIQQRWFSGIVSGYGRRGSDKAPLVLKPQNIVNIHGKGATASQYPPSGNMTFFAGGQSNPRSCH
jgi:hypothetical protein